MPLDAHIKTEKNGTNTVVLTGLTNGNVIVVRHALKIKSKESTSALDILGALDYEINQHPELKELASNGE